MENAEETEWQMQFESPAEAELEQHRTGQDEDEEEEEVCRVCRSGSADGTLFFPCQCAGTMRFVHEGCLSEWLARSKKAKCELCNSPFRYTKVFRSDMPQRLPWYLLLRRALYSLGTITLLVLRASLVAVAWLGLLPYSTLWALRFYLFSSEGIAAFVLLATGRKRKVMASVWQPPAANLSISQLAGSGATAINTLVQRQSPSAVLAALHASASLVSTSPNLSGNLAASLIGREVCALAPSTGPWREVFGYVVRDIFTGQILTSIVVVLFVVGSLLREWIVMHAPFIPEPQPVAPIALLGTNLEETLANHPGLTEAQKQEIRALVGGLIPVVVPGPASVSSDDLDTSSDGWSESSFETFDHDDDATIENAMQPPPLAGPALAFPQPFVPPPPEGIEEDEGFGDDMFEDFDGVLEAIGMTGSLLVLVQNMGLTNLLIALSLGATVWAPLCLGKILAAANAYKLFTRPLLAVRAVTDPIFDALFGVVIFLPKYLVKHAAPPVCQHLLDPFSKFCRYATPPVVAHAVLVSNLTQSPAPLEANTTFGAMSSALPSPSTLRRMFISIADTWEKMCFEEDNWHRGLCIALGYSTVLFCGLVYVKSTRNVYRESFDRAFRELIGQQLLFLKVALFVFVEIIIFPATCGVVLNLATLVLFPDTTIWTRLAFHARAPLSSLLLTWLAGTAFMFSFSLAIDTIRDTVRKGLMWFIRDPASAELHPIREILERDSSTQARKIAISAFLYASVIFSTFGINILFLRCGCVGVLPLRWHYDRLFSFPIDLLLFRFLLPFAIRALDPPAQILKIVTGWAKRTAHQLRLSSFVFGLRDLSEEGTHVRRTWRAKLMLRKAPIEQFGDETLGGTTISPREVVFRKDGGFARVPAVDNVRVVPGRKMVVKVTESGTPLDETGARTIAQQIVEMATVRKDDRYEVVYLPPHFKTRLALFVYLLWLTGSLAVLSAVVIPLVSGRYIFALFTPTPVHDVYSLILGCSIAISLAFILRHRPSFNFSSANFRARDIGITLSFTALVGILLPILTSVFISAYVLLPLSSLPSPSPLGTTLPIFAEINVAQSWATGTMIVSAAYHLVRTSLVPRSHPYRMAVEGATELWKEKRRIQALTLVTGQVAVPLVGRLLGLTVLPGALAFSSHILGPDPEAATFFRRCRLVYTLFAIALSVVVLSASCKGKVTRWVTRLREDEFLVEKRLQNFEAGDEGDLALVVEEVA